MGLRYLLLFYFPIIAYLIVYNQRFTELVAAGDFFAGEWVVLFIFFILATIASYAVTKNHEIYKFLSVHNQQLKEAPEDNLFAKALLTHYHNSKEHPHTAVNIPVMIESYMSDRSLPSNKGSMSLILTLRFIHHLASLTILIGVLGTFIGLVISLAGVNGSQIDQSLIAILSGVHTAFYTSIAGIIYSIVINLHTKYNNSEQLLLQIMLKLENYIHFKDTKTGELKTFEELKKVRFGVDKMTTSLESLGTFSEELSKTTTNLNSFNRKFRDSSENLIKVFGNLSDLTDAFTRQSGSIVHEINQLNTYLKDQQLVLAAVKTAVETSANVFQNTEQFQTTTLAAFMQSMKELESHYKTYFNRSEMNMLSIINSLKTSSEQLSDNFSVLVNEFKAQLQDRSHQDGEVINSLSETQKGIQSSVEALNEHHLLLKTLMATIEKNGAANTKEWVVLHQAMSSIQKTMENQISNAQSTELVTVLEELKETLRELTTPKVV